jgi:DNA-binding response OmpR family regulator
MAKATILVVDKEKILIDLLIRTLSTPNVLVLGATSGDAGARLIETHRPELLVIDPSVDHAVPLITFLRSGEFKTKIVALVGSDDVRRRIDALDVDTVVDRNSGLNALGTAIREALAADLLILSHAEGANILVCDDEDEMCTLLLQFLKPRGYLVSSAKNGKEALEKTQEDPSIQIVLLDVSMPVLGGMDVLKQIMSRDPHPSVIFLTAVADREIAKRAIRGGAFDYILKPCDLAVLESSINACLSYSEYQKQPWWKRLMLK